MTPTKKSPKFDRNTTPNNNFYNKNLRSSVGECLSWKDANEDSAKPARSLPRSQPRSQNNPEIPPKRLFSQSFASKPPKLPLDHLPKPTVHFLDQPQFQNLQNPQTPGHPAKYETPKRASSYSISKGFFNLSLSRSFY